METLIYILVCILLVCSAHIFSAIKSGCFYAAQRDVKPGLLKKYINNLHFAQTPFWYSLFGSFGFMLLAVFRLLHQDQIFINILCAYLIAQGSSTLVGAIYQGFINVGCSLPFVNPSENKRMELANPFNNKTIWIKRFWYGRRRVYLSFAGLVMIVLGLVLMFNPSIFKHLCN